MKYLDFVPSEAFHCQILSRNLHEDKNRVHSYEEWCLRMSMMDPPCGIRIPHNARLTDEKRYERSSHNYDHIRLFIMKFITKEKMPTFLRS